METKFKKGDTMQKTLDNSFFKPHKRSLPKNTVHFSSFRVEKENRDSSHIQDKPKISNKGLKKVITMTNLLVGNNDEDRLNSLLTMKLLRFPATLRKNYHQDIRIITDLLNSPMLSRSSVMRELKCLMSNSSAHQSYLLSRSLCRLVKEQLRDVNGLQKSTFRYQDLAVFLKKLEDKKIDELLEAYKKMLEAYSYPPSVELMMLYIGVHIYSISGHYSKAELLCQRMNCLLIKKRIDKYLIIFLILKYKINASQGCWRNCLPLLSRALAASWLYKQPDLENWCYFEMSRAHFGLSDSQSCYFFRERAQMSINEGDSIFRDMMVQLYQNQVQQMRQHAYSYDESFMITRHQLRKNPQREKPTSNLKAQVYAKTIQQNFKIKHVKNLINRLGEDFPKNEGTLAMAGNPQFLTHESGIKNLNIYFRQGGQEKELFTFQNSHKNILILKQMMRNLLLEMKWFVPIVEN